MMDGLRTTGGRNPARLACIFIFVYPKCLAHHVQGIEAVCQHLIGLAPGRMVVEAMEGQAQLQAAGLSEDERPGKRALVV